jgi:TonB family protein
METLAQDEKLELLLDWTPHNDFDRTRRAAIGTILVHLLLIGFLGSPQMNGPASKPVEIVVKKKRFTPLIDPPTELTQKAPNRKPLNKELSVETILPHPQIKTPVPAVRKFTPPPAPEVAKNQPNPQPVIQPAEPPQISLPTTPVPSLPSPNAQVGPPQPPPPIDKPKLSFQSPTAAPPVPAGPVNPAFTPKPSVDEAVRNIARGGGSGGNVVGDSIDSDSSGMGLNLPPSAGRPRSQLELRSDPMGVDFKPYLQRVLAAVRRNWFAIYPETARMGARGKVVVEFAVAKDGSIPKVVYAGQSGSRPLDEAAVAALSASNPLPPLPAEFKGQRVVLQFTFSYNIPVR